MPNRTTFRPGMQPLELRRCLAAAVVADSPADEPGNDVSTQEWTLVYESIQRVHDNDGDTQDGDLKIGQGDKNGPADAGQTDDVIVDGKIITAENYDSAYNSAVRSGGWVANQAPDPNDPASADAFFSELGSDGGTATQGATWTFTGLAAGDYLV